MITDCQIINLTIGNSTKPDSVILFICLCIKEVISRGQILKEVLVDYEVYLSAGNEIWHCLRISSISLMASRERCV